MSETAAVRSGPKNSPTPIDRGAGMPEPTAALLENWFTFHPPQGDQSQKYKLLRDQGFELAKAIVLTTPPGPEQDAAIRKVREAVMWANSSIACS